MSRKVESVSGKSGDRVLLVPDLGGVGTRPARNGANCQQKQGTRCQKWAQFRFHSASRYSLLQNSCLNSELEIKKHLLQGTLRLVTPYVAPPLYLCIQRSLKLPIPRHSVQTFLCKGQTVRQRSIEHLFVISKQTGTPHFFPTAQKC